MALEPSVNANMTCLIKHRSLEELPNGFFLGSPNQIRRACKLDSSPEIDKCLFRGSPQLYPTLSKGQFLVGCLGGKSRDHVYALFNIEQMKELHRLGGEGFRTGTVFKILEFRAKL